MEFLWWKKILMGLLSRRVPELPQRHDDSAAPHFPTSSVASPKHWADGRDYGCGHWSQWKKCGVWGIFRFIKAMFSILLWLPSPYFLSFGGINYSYFDELIGVTKILVLSDCEVTVKFIKTKTSPHNEVDCHFRHSPTCCWFLWFWGRVSL